MFSKPKSNEIKKASDVSTNEKVDTDLTETNYNIEKNIVKGILRIRPLKINSGDYGMRIKYKVLNKNENGLILKFKFQGNFFNHLHDVGNMPIPPYIRKIRNSIDLDKKDYQSIF